MEPCWLVEARRHLGVREIPGTNDAPFLRRWQAQLGAPWLGPAPWCGVFVGYCLRQCQCEPPKAWYRARAYLDWGFVQPVPAVGSITILERGAASGHVMITVGKTATNRIVGIGGNQGDAVSVASFDRSRVLGYRWPIEAIGSIDYEALPLVQVPASRGES